MKTRRKKTRRKRLDYNPHRTSRIYICSMGYLLYCSQSTSGKKKTPNSEYRLGNPQNNKMKEKLKGKIKGKKRRKFKSQSTRHPPSHNSHASNPPNPQPSPPTTPKNSKKKKRLPHHPPPLPPEQPSPTSPPSKTNTPAPTRRTARTPSPLRTGFYIPAETVLGSGVVNPETNLTSFLLGERR